jgi:hypothetical protein
MSKPIATTTLTEEIARYLAAVDLFRAEGCEPAWRPEVDRGTVLPTSTPPPTRLSSDIRLH